MLEQSAFLDTLNSVKEIIATSEVPMKEAEILSYFKDMNLDAEKQAMVLEYLLNPDNYKQDEAADTQQNETSEPEGEEQVNVYQMYLDELEGLNTYSEEELDDMYKKLLQGDSSMVEKISSAWLMRVTQIAQQYMEPKLVLEDLVQEGNLSLFMRLQTLCGSMEKVIVEEELNLAIEQGVLSYASMIRDAKEMESSVVAKVNLMKAAMDVLTEEEGRVPTIQELSKYTKMTVEELSALQEILDEAK